ncbi:MULTISPECIES: IclR family transcriptional regulator [Arthrobacter]|uniref:IclR family transcriptional regulator n=1 Tax=Arthrobacter psychrochitiniphilus TaxID=291045 RepID=A0A2V3DQS4_9MICC|nr:MULTISPECIES: IclR family transcriptional regulator [Arthrobacter]NYG17380.1 DNA-binding IclR family transcriptional regulator [Arthrobacter psychrochitiniphilus]PXA65371.1 IclR family transcriptional regulator [Arthrobacter psychrochitiniphilus]
MSQSLIRALGLLTQLANGPATLDELATNADVHKTTVMRLLHSLESEHFLVRNRAGEFQLGRKLFELSAKALEERDIRLAARPHLAAINQTTGHTIHLAQLEGAEVVYVDKYESHHPVRMYSRIGLTAALHSAAVAKVILADMPRQQQEQIAAGLDYVQMTENTLTSPEALLTELELVREQGWAHDKSEHESFVHCIAAPIRDASGRVVAAASISVPVVLLSYEDLLKLLPPLITATEAVSKDLGWVPPKGTLHE